MHEIKGINHIGLRVADLATAREFYEQLGFVFIVGPVGPEPVAIMKHPSGININFILNANNISRGNVLMDADEKYPGYTHVAFDVNDLDSAKVKLDSMNITITEGPVIFPGGRSLFLRDPDRNVIEFHEPEQK